MFSSFAFYVLHRLKQANTPKTGTVPGFEEFATTRNFPEDLIFGGVVDSLLNYRKKTDRYRYVFFELVKSAV